MSPMPIWELVVVSFACLLGSFAIFLPLLIGERSDEREKAASAAQRASKPSTATHEHDHPSGDYKSAA